MSVSNAGRTVLLSVTIASAMLGSCFAEPDGIKGGGGVASVVAGSGTDAVAGVASEGGATAQCSARPADPDARCRPVKSSEPLYSKLVSDEPQDSVVFVDDLFQQFKVHCGACHVDTNLGKTPFQATQQNFFQRVGQKAVDAIKSDTEFCTDGQANCLDFMPPRSSNGKPWSERKDDPTDPLRRFVDQLESWLASQKPGEAYPPLDVFILPASKGGRSAYPVDEDFAQSLTNLGTCIPDAGMVATENAKACDLDAAFAEMKRDPNSPSLAERIGLPLSLQQTDLFTLDSAELARYGVVAYQPTYPLWTDDAGKLRYIRVPRGQSVKYDKASKTFDIPDNTRFYKIFLKEVLALDGKPRYRKIETRVIVARKNGEALFGTYEWNDEETQATLVTAPLRSGEPFTDVLKTLIVDEPAAALLKQQKDSGEITNYTYELDQAHAVRRYAIPGSERCIQCHMGNESFVLAFSPLQVGRRPCDQQTLDAQGYCDGGVLHETGEDELTQLERLISYGVITGMTADDVPKLEDPQGPADAPRNARTPEELVAQGYLLGNCAHCHNPIGYPTMANPELKDLLDFLPSEVGGIFAFPLDRYSPRIKRGSGGDVQLPYITPSLRDIIPAGSSPTNPNPSEKWSPKVGLPAGAGVSARPVVIDAPWRSLIYRNVDTPFTYTDNYAIYPHMPLNSPGFDCRAPRILGQWMVSIPAVRKHPELSEDLPAGDVNGADSDPQPYLEVKPGDAKYALGLEQTKKRLDTYRKGARYTKYCPDTRDIVDLDVMRGKRVTPIDGSGSALGLPLEGVPDRSHWVITDLTETPGDWTPRRNDWKSILVEQKIPPVALKPGENGYADALADHDAQVQLVQYLQTVKVTDDFKSFALKKLPFGLWETAKHDCTEQLGSVPRLGDYEAKTIDNGGTTTKPEGPRVAERMRWMDVVDQFHVKSDLPVYETTPGQAVFNMICVNCHGPNADSKGRQATTLQEMTGGTGRVANFRDGLFGPAGSGGANRMRVFGSEDLAARYLPWMALGGTKTKIPQAILDLVNQTPVLGEKRQGATTIRSANMLQVAQALCEGVANLGTSRSLVPSELRGSTMWSEVHHGSGLILANGDAELWERLCSFDNPAPIHVYSVNAQTADVAALQSSDLDTYRAEKYPPNAAIGNRFGERVAQWTKDNTFAWCVVTPTDPNAVAWLAKQKTSDKDPQPLPTCPPEFLANPDSKFKAVPNGTTGYDHPDTEAWATRGAVNAGLAVFLYLDWLVSQDHSAPPRFNECEMFKP